MTQFLKLLLIRHAESIGNTQRRMEGQQSTALSPLGQQQAQSLAKGLIPPLISLRTQPPNPLPQNPLRRSSSLPSHLYISPLLRAIQTANELQAGLDQVQHTALVQRSANLQEMHPGIFQNLTWAEATAQHPALCKQLMTTLEWQPVPQSESPIEARNRAQQWINKLLTSHSPGDTIWAVSHAGIMLHMIAAIMGCDRTWKITIHHTAIFEFWLASTHWNHLSQDRFNPEYWSIRRFNDTAHLKHL
ncbi:MAG: histidine phosphatase family protein [Cyanobacteria bacterium P01_D01_bin.36]